MATIFFPSGTKNAAGNVLASVSIAAGATSSASTLDLSADDWAEVQFGCTFGAAAATSGLQLNVFKLTGSAAAADTIATWQPVIPATASSTQKQSIRLTGGAVYSLSLTNIDAANGVSAAFITADTYVITSS